MLTRTAHAPLGNEPHRPWLYVDDLLALLRKTSCAKPTCALLAFLSCINAPVLWKKAQLGEDIVWCGWSFNFSLETVHLAQPKLVKLREQLQALHRSKKVPRKLLEATLGLLICIETCAALQAPSSLYIHECGKAFLMR